MPDLEKALDAVAYGIRAAESAGDRMGRSHVVMMKTDDLDNILELLKAQEPIEPIKHLSTGQICGSCKKVLLRKYKYCPACGQAVKWDD